MSSPLASCGVLGITTFNPGTCANSACRAWECWAPCSPPRLMTARIPTGKEIGPIRRLVHDGICRQQHEIHARMKHDRAHPRDRRSDRRPGGGIFRNRRINHALPTELLIEILQARSRIPWIPDTLADEKH